MPYRRLLTTIALIVCAGAAGSEPGTCLGCHADKESGFSAAHAFAATDCVACHAGNKDAELEADAHDGMLAFPGDLSNAQRACGTCHANRVSSVPNSLMHSGRGIVHKTRLLLDGTTGPPNTVNLQSLGHTVADSMLRKQCASCHLGQSKTSHAHDVTSDRGGGCLACHINDYPEGAHPALSINVSDGRCFGCHSRSGRISLSYAGLAEVDSSDLRLADGRPVARMPADVHYLAGMSCRSCHTGDDLMGSAGDAIHQREAVDIACTDCHDSHADDDNHERLTCASCHSQWAPQCFGCHMSYDAEGEQWDHVDRKMTPGRWHDRLWDVRNALPALGVNQSGKIELFVPGMIMTVAHPSWEQERFFRMFAPLSPHTIGRSRSCESCHRSSEALGLGRGRLVEGQDEYSFEPANDILQDGLAADTWTDLTNSLGGRAPIPGQRPLNEREMKTVLDAEIPEP